MIDELDTKLIVELQRDSRQSNRRLATFLGINEATVRRRIQYLVSSGTIILTAVPDLSMLGYPLRVHFIISVEHSRIDDVGRNLRKIPSLRFIATCVGTADFVARGNFESLDSLVDVTAREIGKIEGINQIDSLIESKRLKFTYHRIGVSAITKKKQPNCVIHINETDRRLILLLQKDARTPLKELTKQLGLSDSTVSRHIRDLVSSETIELTAIPDNSKVGYPIRCSLRIATVPSMIMEIAESIAQYSQVSTVVIVSGPVQILVGMHLASADNLSKFVETELNKIKGIRGIEVLTYLKILKNNYSWLQE
ncbi:MAG TPA: Lrp/AsnC family transcriptional regulator [Dehalococcoidales bacterium]|nr:Lrp/AsnC family transcriptional regulator [Dehalococcoidales bacterium]